MSLNQAMGVARQSLEVFTTGVQVAGHNIANASTPGYIREQLLVEPNAPYSSGQLIIGSGVRVTGIRQQIDTYLESRIYSANSEYQAAGVREAVYQQLETSLQELGETDLSTALNRLVSMIHDVVNQPETPAVAQLAVQEGQRLAADIVGTRVRVDELRQAQNQRVQTLVDEANLLVEQVQMLNEKIVSAERGGFLASDAGALRTQRYGALNRLSEIIPIRVHEQTSGAVDIYTGSDYLLTGNQRQLLETTLTPDRDMGVLNVRLSQTNAPLPGAGGELRGVIDGRDKVLGGFVAQLDRYTAALIHEFNLVHASGEGIKGFTTVTSASKVDSASAPLSAAGLAFPPQHGSFQLKIVNAATGLIETRSIGIDLDGIGTDTTLDDLRATLDGLDRVSARITFDGRLEIKAEPGYELRFANDTSGVLAALGINTFFTGRDSASIGVNGAVVADAGLFAAGRGGGPSDGSNAVRLAALVDQPSGMLQGLSLDHFYDKMIASVAQNSAAESALARGFEGFKDSLLTQRAQRSGVSLDEEAIKMLEFQRAYQAAARLIANIDELFNVLLTM